MANLIDEYRQKRQAIYAKEENKCIPSVELLELQELNYRIMVMENLEAFCKTAPITTKQDEIAFHYQIANANIQYLLSEHRFGPRVTEELAKKRETAHLSLERVIASGKQHFMNFSGTSEREYKDKMTNYIMSIIPMWIQYRNLYWSIH